MTVMLLDFIWWLMTLTSNSIAINFLAMQLSTMEGKKYGIDNNYLKFSIRTGSSFYKYLTFHSVKMNRVLY